MRQLTKMWFPQNAGEISKLPMRQLTTVNFTHSLQIFSKLPMRQLTIERFLSVQIQISKLPMRQLTMPERKKNPTARALIHLFSTLTQIYSCFEIY